MPQIKKHTSFLAAILLAGVFCVQSQEVQFSQFYNAPFYINPALAGETKYDRLGLQYRDQWPGIDETYKTFTAFYDKKLKGIKGGLGLYLLRDVAGSGALTTTTASANYGYGLQFNHRMSFRFGLRFGVSNTSIDQNKLLFADQVVRDFASTTIERFDRTSATYLDVGAGGEIKDSKTNVRLGIFLEHLNQGAQSFNKNAYNVPIKYSGYVMYDHILKGMHSYKRPVYATVGLMYKAQEKWDQFEIGANYHYDLLEVGLWYRGLPGKSYEPGYSNNEAIILYVGYQLMSAHIGYNYDVTISDLGYNNSGGAHEVSVMIALGGKRRGSKNKRRAIPCPELLGNTKVKF